MIDSPWKDVTSLLKRPQLTIKKILHPRMAEKPKTHRRKVVMQCSNSHCQKEETKVPHCSFKIVTWPKLIEICCQVINNKND